MPSLKPRPHADLIKAWADGAQIQIKSYSAGKTQWKDLTNPRWHGGNEYRIKPENTVYYAEIRKLEHMVNPQIIQIIPVKGEESVAGWFHIKPNLKLVMDDEGKLISAEVI